MSTASVVIDADGAVEGDGRVGAGSGRARDRVIS